ncbi:GNAT family N-acetyltransferase (plasmid) [Nocardioides sp. R1-1]|uniref:GNAT family N-acetyltransferase n=1 Tax=Nocardioides sp. R1-1 TaxID=3383502 RepID=UPI0038D1E420
MGYRRLDISWGGDAEIFLAVERSAQQRGIGSFILASLEDEAARRGINYVFNVIRDHAQRVYVHDWLVVRGVRGAIDGDLRKRVVGSAEPDHEGEIREETYPEATSQQEARARARRTRAATWTSRSTSTEFRAARESLLISGQRALRRD